MNAFKPLLSTSVRRFASSAAPKSAVPPLQKYSLKKAWFSDPSTYPLIVIMGCALTFMTGMGLHALTSYKDVTIDKKKRGQMLQTWGTEETPSVLSRAVHWCSWQKNAPEGLGVDHQKWLEEKKKRDTAEL